MCFIIALKKVRLFCGSCWSAHSRLLCCAREHRKKIIFFHVRNMKLILTSQQIADKLTMLMKNSHFFSPPTHLSLIKRESVNKYLALINFPQYTTRLLFFALWLKRKSEKIFFNSHCDCAVKTRNTSMIKKRDLKNWEVKYKKQKNSQICNNISVVHIISPSLCLPWFLPLNKTIIFVQTGSSWIIKVLWKIYNIKVDARE